VNSLKKTKTELNEKFYGELTVPDFVFCQESIKINGNQ